MFKLMVNAFCVFMATFCLLAAVSLFTVIAVSTWHAF